MKFFMKKDGAVAQTQVGKEAYQKYFMAPMEEGNESVPAENKIISHQFNSHTIRPKFACKQTEYPQ